MIKYLVLGVFLFLSAVATTYTYHYLNQAGHYYIKGKILFESEAYEQAIPFLQEAVKLRTNFLSALVKLGHAAMWTRRYTLAQECFERVLAIDPNNVDAKLGLANILNWTERRPEAISHYLSLLKEKKNNVAINISLAEAYFWEGEYDNSIYLLERLRKEGLSNEKVLLYLARSYQKSGNSQKGLQTLEELRREFGDSVEVYQAYAAYYTSIDDYMNALFYYQKILDKHPDHLATVIDVANIHAQKGNWDIAIDKIDYALSINPNDLNLKRTKAHFLLWSKDYVASRKIFEDILTILPRDKSSQVGIARSFAWEGKTVHAIKLYEKILAEQDPKDPVLYKELAHLYLLNKNYQESQKIFKDVVLDNSYPPNSSDLMALSYVYAGQKQYLQSIKQLKALLRKEPNNLAAKELLLDMYIASGDLKKAQKILVGIIAINKHNKKLREKLADLYSWQGKFKLAEMELKRIIEEFK